LAGEVQQQQQQQQPGEEQRRTEREEQQRKAKLREESRLKGEGACRLHLWSQLQMQMPSLRAFEEGLRCGGGILMHALLPWLTWLAAAARSTCREDVHGCKQPGHLQDKPHHHQGTAQLAWY
jgi:hypothetical protein